MIVSRVGRFKNNDDVTEVLLGLLEDEVVALHATGALRSQIGAAAAKDHIEPLLQSPNDQIRRQAKEQLRRIEKTLNRAKR